MRRFVLVVSLSACHCSSDSGSRDASICPAAAPAARTGDGTYYDATGAGSCSFAASPDDLMVAAMNAPDYANAAWCGGCLAVTGPMGDVVVRVVDECPGCKTGDLDLSREAFAKLSPLSAGRIAISWHEVPCEVEGPIAYQLKDGSNAYWTAIQLRNHRYPIARLEAQTGTGWTEIARANYNYFVAAAGLGAGPYAVRVTDTRGQVLTDTIPLTLPATQPGSAQFAVCP